MNMYYHFTVPVFTKALKALDGLITKAQASGKPDSEHMQARLAPDMFPFVKQVQVACDNAKGITARLAGVTAPTHEDTEQSLAELHTRIAKTIEFVESVPESAFDGAAERKIVLPYFGGKFMTGNDYLQLYGLANFFFHVSTAYAILRNQGIEIGKVDYLGGVPLQDENES